MASPLVAHDRVDLVHDDRLDRLHHPAATLAPEEKVEGLGCGHEDVGRPTRHGCTLARGGVARADQHAHLRNGRVAGADLGQRRLEVLLDVIGERAKRRDIKNLRLVRQGARGARRSPAEIARPPPHQGIDGP